MMSFVSELDQCRQGSRLCVHAPLKTLLQGATIDGLIAGHIMAPARPLDRLLAADAGAVIEDAEAWLRRYSLAVVPRDEAAAQAVLKPDGRVMHLELDAMCLGMGMAKDSNSDLSKYIRRWPGRTQSPQLLFWFWMLSRSLLVSNSFPVAFRSENARGCSLWPRIRDHGSRKRSFHEFLSMST